ncbi:Hypothetical protein R9X50_00034200 [Acrodontium crateriforme]|uniref:Zf-UBP-domain-containing protein n=1 Tax=Acrodontium crateriforme TaxID=150365 RepID=A0AAQ3M0G1_9PEZI|nr:Hypothetical protein R9X50_00034200 [Acrodontium crateriforme]
MQIFVKTLNFVAQPKTPELHVASYLVVLHRYDVTGRPTASNSSSLMPSSYFFHLRLELYPAPPSPNARHYTGTQTIQTFVPPPGTDIFATRLPVHETHYWSSSISAVNDTPNLSPPRTHTESHRAALLLPERNLYLKDSPVSTVLKRAVEPSNETTARDWRYDAVSIEGLDMVEGSRRMDNKSGASTKSAVSGLHTKAVFFPSDPKTTNVGWGVVHLYRDTEESTYLDDDAALRRSLDRARPAKSDVLNPDDCTTLCILAVPSWMMPSDLLGFVGDQAREDVSHFRLIRTGRANKYMVLMKFRQAKRAREWQKIYNGRLFSAAEPENCHVVFIKSVEFLSPGSGFGNGTSFPQTANDPFTSEMSTKPYAPPPPNLLELPTCPVCLERMDETTGLLTILCQHVFHCACLEKWRGGGCPVCRYTHSPSYTFPYPRPSPNSPSAVDEQAEALCSVCAATANLWICLICGNIGCGRYDSAHAYAHYEATSHCYAMDINTQHVWDYAGDGYVHRLIQSKPDSTNKNTELPPRHANEAFRAEGGESVPREKMESMANEYTYLLTSQLEGQRRYFEEQVERAVDKASEASARAEEAAANAEKALAQLAISHSQQQDARSAVERMEKALEKSEKAKERFEQMARSMSVQLQEEKAMNEGLSKRITTAEEKAKEAVSKAEQAEEAKKELEDLNHDLTMFISSQEKVKELQAQGEEVMDGTVSVPEVKKGKGRKKR